MTVSHCVSARDGLQVSAPVPAVAEPSLQPLCVHSQRASAIQHSHFGIDSCGSIHPFSLLSRVHVGGVLYSMGTTG